MNKIEITTLNLVQTNLVGLLLEMTIWSYNTALTAFRFLWTRLLLSLLKNIYVIFILKIFYQFQRVYKYSTLSNNYIYKCIFLEKVYCNVWTYPLCPKIEIYLPSWNRKCSPKKKMSTFLRTILSVKCLQDKYVRVFTDMFVF